MGMTADGSVYEEVVERDADGKPLRTRWVGAIDLGRGPDGKRRRKDREYGWYRDADSDGIVCE